MLRRLALLAIAALALWRLWADAMELFIAWYSGAEPVSPAPMWWVAGEMLALAAAIVCALWLAFARPPAPRD